MNSIIAFLYEAFPEEVIFRGFLYSALRLRLGQFLAVLMQTVLFVLFPIALVGLQHLFGFNSMSITPDYVILIASFGLALQIIRLLLNNLWASIGFHLAYLEIARFVVPQGEQPYIEGIPSILSYDELEPGIGMVFLLLIMIIFMSILLGTLLLVILKIMRHKSTVRR